LRAWLIKEKKKDLLYCYPKFKVAVEKRRRVVVVVLHFGV
jgi:hypothetical protein